MSPTFFLLYQVSSRDYRSMEQATISLDCGQMIFIASSCGVPGCRAIAMRMCATSHTEHQPGLGHLSVGTVLILMLFQFLALGLGVISVHCLAFFTLAVCHLGMT
jgi:hypothetical protein